MKISALPQRIFDYLFVDRLFPKNPLFVQMATQSNNEPHVRTMRLYDIVNDTGELIFLTHCNTQKYEDLISCHNVEVILYDECNQVQIRASGQSKLIRLNELDGGILYWNQVPIDAKKLYSSSRKDLMEIPDSCFAIIVIAHYWEYLEINLNNYLFSSLFQYRSCSHWEEEKSQVQS